MILSLLLLPLLAPAQETPAPLAARLDPALRELVERLHLPGLAVGITDAEGTLYARGFGKARRGSEQAVTPESIFHMASVSKPFVATAVMQLVERGKMDLDATLVSYLPYFALDDERHRTITIRQMLRHTSGMPDVRDYEWDKPQFDEGAAERFVRSLAGEEMLFDPGTSYRYSNMAFDTLGDVIAKVSGMPFEAFVQRNILDPLGMESSSFIHAETPAALRTIGHALSWSERIDFPPCPVYPYNRRHAPSSTLNSNIVDMCKWARANLNQGQGQERILKKVSYGVLWAPNGVSSTGLSWFLDTYGDRPTVGHGGADTGYRSQLRLLPEQGLAVVAMANADRAPIGTIANILTNAALGIDFELPSVNISIPFAFRLEEDGVGAAIELYFELRETEPERWEFSYQELEEIGTYLVELERHDEAVEVLAFNADLYPSNPRGHVALGRALVAAGDAVAARESFEYALGLAPTDAEAREALAELGG